jgi:hypothetical protein
MRVLVCGGRAKKAGVTVTEVAAARAEWEG